MHHLHLRPEMQKATRLKIHGPGVRRAFDADDSIHIFHLLLYDGTYYTR